MRDLNVLRDARYARSSGQVTRRDTLPSPGDPPSRPQRDLRRRGVELEHAGMIRNRKRLACILLDKEHGQPFAWRPGQCSRSLGTAIGIRPADGSSSSSSLGRDNSALRSRASALAAGERLRPLTGALRRTGNSSSISAMSVLVCASSARLMVPIRRFSSTVKSANSRRPSEQGQSRAARARRSQASRCHCLRNRCGLWPGSSRGLRGRASSCPRRWPPAPQRCALPGSSWRPTEAPRPARS